MDSESNICQIAALKHGRLVLSETYLGYSKDDCCHIASATKSIVGLLIGIAIDQRKIDSVDDKVLSYFPEYTPKRGGRIISEQWIDEMTTGREVEGTMFRGMSYGYLWWIIHPEAGVYAAIGNSGNVIYVNPAADTVVAMTAYFKPSVMDRIDFIEKAVNSSLM